MQRCLQAHSRLGVLLVDCKLYDAGLAALNELLAVLQPGDPGRLDANRRIAEARLGIRKKQAANHYKLLGLARNCPPDEVSPLADSLLLSVFVYFPLALLTTALPMRRTCYTGISLQVRRVYKKLALKFHPDKALSNCKFATAITPSAAKLASQTEVILVLCSDEEATQPCSRNLSRGSRGSLHRWEDKVLAVGCRDAFTYRNSLSAVPTLDSSIKKRTLPTSVLLALSLWGPCAD